MFTVTVRKGGFAVKTLQVAEGTSVHQVLKMWTEQTNGDWNQCQVRFQSPTDTESVVVRGEDAIPGNGTLKILNKIDSGLN